MLTGAMGWISQRHTAEEGNPCPLIKQPNQSECQENLQETLVLAQQWIQQKKQKHEVQKIIELHPQSKEKKKKRVNLRIIQVWTPLRRLPSPSHYWRQGQLWSLMRTAAGDLTFLIQGFPH